MKYGLKRLTMNDVSWFKPNSKSHQSGINLPLKAFKNMFLDLIEQHDQEIPPRQSYETLWYNQQGEILTESTSEVIYYMSKNELRLVHIPKQSLSQFIENGMYLLIANEMDQKLSITCMDSSEGHLLHKLGFGWLIERLPPKKE